MDQLPLDGRITDLAGFARLGAEGVDLLLSDSTNAEIPGFVTPGAGDRPGARLDLREGDRPHHRRVVRLARAPGAAGARLGRRSTGARSPLSAGRWCATWASPATSACCASRPAWWSGWTRRPACRRTEIVLMSTGSQGEPMSALGRMATGDHRHITIAAGRHRRAGQLAGAGQRDRRLPGHQPALPGRGERRAQGRRQGARLRARARRRTALPAQRGQTAQLHARTRRVAAPARPRPPRARVGHPDRPDRAVRGRGRGRPGRRRRASWSAT